MSSAFPLSPHLLSFFLSFFFKFPSLLPLINYCSYCMTSTPLGSEVQWGKRPVLCLNGVNSEFVFHIGNSSGRRRGEGTPTKGRKFPHGRRDSKIHHWPFSPQLMLLPGAEEFPICPVKGEEGTEHAPCSLSPSSPLLSLIGLTQTHTLLCPAEVSPRPPHPTL